MSYKRADFEELHPEWEQRDGHVIFNHPNPGANHLAAGWCGDCHMQVSAIPVIYADDHPDFYMGVSEYECPVCGRREGRWTRRLLGTGETEPKFGEPRE